MVSIRVRDGFGFEFSGFSFSIIRNYFLRATLELCVNKRAPPKICHKNVKIEANAYQWINIH